MARRNKRGLVSAAAVVIAAVCCAQQGSTFAYTGEDAAVSAMNVHHAQFAGFSNSVLVIKDDDAQFVWPYLPAFFYEYDHLIMPRNDAFNGLLSVTPEVNFFPWFMGRVTGLVELGLLADADNDTDKGAGLRVGAGYSAFGTTFGFSELTPVVRFGFSMNNIRITYMYGTKEGLYINHQITVGLKLDR